MSVCSKCHIRAVWRMSDANMCWWCHGRPDAKPPESGEFKVGESYTLNCLVFMKGAKEFCLPILHSHVGDISGEMHHHLNQQFTPDDFLKMTDCTPQMMLAAPDLDSPRFGGTGKIEPRRVLCIRPPQAVMYHRTTNQDEFDSLQDKMVGKKMADGICPHQGCSLKGQNPVVVKNAADEDMRSVLVCPCHGMCWDAETGDFVRVEKEALDPVL